MSIIDRFRESPSLTQDTRTAAPTPATAQPSWQVRLALLVPAAVVLLVGGWGINRGSMWQDEATTLALAGRPLPQLWHTLANVDAVHGAYYLLIHPLLVTAQGGVPPEVLIRLPSLLGAAAAAAGVAVIGRRLVSTAAGLFAGTVYATSPAVSYYAQEGRSYALVSAAVVLATYLLLKAADQRRGWWAGYAAALAAACLLNLLAVLVLVAHGVTLLVSRAGRATLWRWAAACLAGLLPAVPVAWVSSRQQNQISWLVRPGWSTVGDLITRFVGAGALLALLTVLVILALLPITGVKRRSSISLPALALPLTVLPPALLLITSQVHPLYQDRYILYSTAGLALLAGTGLHAAGRLITLTKLTKLTKLGIVAECALLALVIVFTLPAHARVRRVDSRRDDPAAVARIVQAEARPGDTVLYLPSIRRLVAEAYPRAFQQVRDIALKRTGAVSGTLAGRELSPRQIAKSLGKAPRVWAISRSYPRDSDLSSPQDTTKRRLLREHYRQVRITRVLGYAVRLYVRAG